MKSNVQKNYAKYVGKSVCVFQLILFLLAFSSSSLNAQMSRRVLFIGNSYTYTHNLPEVVKLLALAGGDTLIHDSYAPGGYRWSQHSTDPNTIGKINVGTWDYVVLQEQSQIPSFPQPQVEAQCYPYARKLDSLIHAKNPCAQTIFYMTWGRKYGDPMNCANVPYLCTFNGMQAALRYSYLKIANELGGIVAPAGPAWQRCMTEDPDSLINLFSGDLSHPAPAGTYLTACVFYATIFHKTPVGLPYHFNLPPAQATFMQNIAHTVVFDSLALWNTMSQVVALNTNPQLNQNQLQIGASANKPILNCTWDFGDGTQDEGTNVVHTYTNPGTYIVQAKALTDCGTFSKQDTVYISPASVLQRSVGTGICAGTTATLSAQGAVNYQWQPATGLNTTTGPEVIASPEQTTVYTLSVVFPNGLTYSDTIIVQVFPLPSLNLSVNAQGATVEVSLSATGGTPPYQYRLESEAWGTNSVFNLPIPGSYTFAVRDSNACEQTQLLNLTARNQNLSAELFQLYPNPNTGSFIVSIVESGDLSVFDYTGKIVYTTQVQKGTHHLTTNLPTGLYHYRLVARNTVLSGSLSIQP